jgi:GWxTD domain-containing protein
MVGNLQAQFPEFNFDPDTDAPDFYYDAITLSAEDSGMSLLRLFTKVAFDELQFIQEEDHYRAGYEVSISVLNQDEEQVDFKIIQKTVRTYEFNSTNSPKDFSLAGAELKLQPGTYNLIMNIMDVESKKSGQRKTQVIVHDYDTSALDMSELLLVDYAMMDSTGKIVIRPNVLANFGETQESMYLWYEIYSRDAHDSVHVIYRIKNMKGDQLREKEHYKLLEGERTENVVEIPRGDLKSGRYNLEVKVEDDDSSVKRTQVFTIRWIGMPTLATDLDKAIEQMKHIAKGKYIKKMKKAKEDEKRRLFEEFWRELDPTPGTLKNELMDEYYRRVEYADVNFASYREGWKTDRGMLYIVLGPPDDIDRRSYDLPRRPREVWYYYKIDRVFVFIDQTGMGEYRLTSPFWDVIH